MKQATKGKQKTIAVPENKGQTEAPWRSDSFSDIGRAPRVRWEWRRRRGICRWV